MWWVPLGSNSSLLSTHMLLAVSSSRVLNSGPSGLLWSLISHMACFGSALLANVIRVEADMTLSLEVDILLPYYYGMNISELPSGM